MAVLVILVLIAVYFSPVLFGRQVFYYGDILSIFWPFKQWFFSQIHRGVFPLWNPHIFSGYPVFADMTLSTFYPPAWVLFFNDSMKSVSLLIVAHFFIAGYFTYLLGKKLSLSTIASLFSAVIYTFSGIMVNYIADPQRFFVISWLPAFFFFLFQGRILLLALILALQIFAGHIQYVFIEVLAGLVFWRRWTGLFWSLAIAGLLTAVALLPMLKFIPLTTRLEIYQDLAVYQSFSLHPATLARFILAHFWGIKNQGFQWGTLDTTTIGYIGFIPLLLIYLNRRHLKRQFLWPAGISLIISFGTYLPYFKILTTYIPLFSLFRNPMAFLVIYSFFMALLAGMSLDRVRFRRSRLFWLAAAAGAAALAAINFNRELPHQLLIWLSGIVGKSLSRFHSVDVDWQIAKLILTNLFLVSSLAALAFKLKIKWVFVLMTIIDLFIFTRSNYYTLDQKYLILTSPVTNFLQENLGGYRYLSSSETVPYNGLNDLFGTLDTQPMAVSEIGRRLEHELKLLPPNFGMIHNLSTINGYTSFVMKDYFRLFQGKEINPLYSQFSRYNPQITERRSDLALSKIDLAHINLDDPLFDRLGVKYFVTDRDLGLSQDQLVFSDGKIDVYQNERFSETGPFYTNNYPPRLFYLGAWISGISWLVFPGLLAKLRVRGRWFSWKLFGGN